MSETNLIRVVAVSSFKNFHRSSAGTENDQGGILVALP
jgi:hypothetical protein